MKIAAVILTLDEERHLARCLDSVHGLTKDVLVVDAFSSDATPDVARSNGAQFLQHAWINYASQFNWALTRLDPSTDWVLRIDADEVLTEELVNQVNLILPTLELDVGGIYVDRCIRFQGKVIRYGGVFRIPMLRLFRYGRGRCEQRWMDEHIVVEGRSIRIREILIDDNLKSITWWVAKHNRYASREAIDLLNLRYKFMPRDVVGGPVGSRAAAKRWVKESIYSHLPVGIRAFVYFLYRYVLRLGFLDGRMGLTFHFLQGFWYRFLVDVKVREVESYIAENRMDVVSVIEKVLGIKIPSIPDCSKKSP